MITKTPINILTLLSDQNTSRYQTFSKTLLQTALSFEHNVGSSWFWPIRNNFHTQNQNNPQIFHICFKNKSHRVISQIKLEQKIVLGLILIIFIVSSNLGPRVCW